MFLSERVGLVAKGVNNFILFGYKHYYISFFCSKSYLAVG